MMFVQSTDDQEEHNMHISPSHMYSFSEPNFLELKMYTYYNMINIQVISGKTNYNVSIYNRRDSGKRRYSSTYTDQLFQATFSNEYRVKIRSLKAGSIYFLNIRTDRALRTLAIQTPVLLAKVKYNRVRNKIEISWFDMYRTIAKIYMDDTFVMRINTSLGFQSIGVKNDNYIKMRTDYYEINTLELGSDIIYDEEQQLDPIDYVRNVNKNDYIVHDEHNNVNTNNKIYKIIETPLKNEKIIKNEINKKLDKVKVDNNTNIKNIVGSKLAQKRNDNHDLDVWFMVILPVGVVLIVFLSIFTGYLVQKSRRKKRHKVERLYEPWGPGYDIQVSSV